MHSDLVDGVGWHGQAQRGHTGVSENYARASGWGMPHDRTGGQAASGTRRGGRPVGTNEPSHGRSTVPTGLNSPLGRHRSQHCVLGYSQTPLWG